jgi:hypothetical protein
MAEKKVSKKDMSVSQKVGLGVGLTAAAVAAAGAFFLYGSKNASANRKKVKSWTLKAKGEVLEALEKAEHISKDEYLALVNTISGAYATLQQASAGEVRDFKKEMTEHWQKIEKSAAVKKLTKAAKSVGKKAAPKAAAGAKKAPRSGKTSA